MLEGEEDDRESEPDTDGETKDNDEPKNGLPGLITPGDSGIEYSCESDSEDEPWEVNRDEEDAHYKGTEFYKEFSDKTNNAPGKSKVEEEELKCPKLSTGEICPAYKSEGDLTLYLWESNSTFYLPGGMEFTSPAFFHHISG